MIFGKDSLSEVYTFLTKVNDADGNVDLAQSIYIDWGAFINAVINFFIVAFVLFCIVKLVNKFRAENREVRENFKKKTLTKAQKAELKAKGIKISDKAAVKAYFEEKAKQEAEAKKAAEAAAAEAARLEKEANPSAETLLKEIRDLLKNKA